MYEFKQNFKQEALTEADLRAANVNPVTGLATDFLNPFNEYLMLAEMVETGSMPPDVLHDWLPIDYETHFARSGFASAEVTIIAYRSLPNSEKQTFETAVGYLIDTIVAHQEASLHNHQMDLKVIANQRDVVANLITGNASVAQEDMSSQSAIDALFD